MPENSRGILRPLGEYKEEYERLKELGRGRFGIVHLVRAKKRVEEDMMAAAKHIRYP